jgi:hypothetical protein
LAGTVPPIDGHLPIQTAILLMGGQTTALTATSGFPTPPERRLSRNFLFQPVHRTKFKL